MKIAVYIIRFLLALLFFWAGVEKLFLPYDPSVFRANAADSNPLFFEFYDLLQRAGYLYFVGFFQLLCGVMLVFKRTYLLGSVMMVPLVLCLVMTHIFFSKNVFYIGFDSAILLFVVFLIGRNAQELNATFFKKQSTLI
ncbi:MAG: DoxX family membrane protein [Chloroflexia bacterium]|nr:DoxX family membrane protein [Chloroflexia bacterium]